MGALQTIMAGFQTPRLRQFLLATFFALCMFPITVGGDDGGGAVSINYLFLLYPVLMAAMGKLRHPPEAYLFAITFYSLIFVVSAIYQIDLLSDFTRRLTSFVLFIGIFSYMFVEIEDWMISAFKISVVLAACYFSLKSLITFFLLGGSAKLGFAAKDAIGSQRYGFIYLTAFWIVYLNPVRSLLMRALKPILIFIALLGLVLTFSRASIVALMVSFAFFMAWSISLRGVSASTLVKGGLITLVGGVIVYFIISTYFPIILTFFGDRLFSLLADSSKVEAHLETSTSSEGARLQVWATILDFISQNPFTGAGYLGVWIVSKTAGLASAHNQYFDVLFRTGVFGFVIYVALLFQAGNYLRTKDLGLFWGLIGTLIYGMFHETFKESQGAFVLTFLLGLVAQSTPRLPDLPGLRDFAARTPPKMSSGG